MYYHVLTDHKKFIVYFCIEFFIIYSNLNNLIYNIGIINICNIFKLEHI